MKKILSFLLFVSLLFSCESEQAKKEGFVYEQKQNEFDQTEAINLEKARMEQEEANRLEQDLYNKYISNSLNTGATPYSNYYGTNSSCNEYGCSEIKVRTSNSDVLVTIKKNEKVVRHAFIQAGDSYSLSFPNGTYQAFFYSGKGWNPEKAMKGGELKGGFITNENFGKDDPQLLNNNVLEYELILQQDGNFSSQPSNSEEAL